MKHLLTLLLSYSTSYTAFAQEDFKEAFLIRWDHMESYTLEMLDAIPDSLMEYRPVEEVATMEDHFRHIAQHLTWISNDFLSKDGMESEFDPDDLSIKQAVEGAFRLVRDRVNDLDEIDMLAKNHFRPANRELSRFELLYLLLDHTRNHTGQLVVYLRLNGIAPPKYQGW